MNLKFGLVALLISSFFASIVQFNFGKTEITLENLDTVMASIFIMICTNQR